MPNKNSELYSKIERLKKEKNALILAHYYTPAEVQMAADCLGDSFYLAKVAKNSTADIIVFCGVSFMGESAKLLCPDKKVIMPDISADCPMAHMVAKGKIAEMREKYDDLAVVCYINSTAELKSMSDVCVTSSNAVKIVSGLPNKNIFFIPDKNLGAFVAEQLPEKNVIINDGYCPIHASLPLSALLEKKNEHPNARVLSHPECEREILENSDYIGSTADIIKYANEIDADEFIICTEIGVKYMLEKQNPDKKFYFTVPAPICTDMKLCTLEKVAEALEKETNEVYTDENRRETALLPLERMLGLGK